MEPRHDVGSHLRSRRSRSSFGILLRDRAFQRLFASQAISAFGDWIGMIAILTLVKNITENEFAVAAALLARLAPALFFGPVAGVIADRWDRKKLMVACDLIRGGLVLVLAFILPISEFLHVPAVILLFVISAALETCTLLWAPAKDASVPHLVPPEQLAKANSLILLAAYATFPLSGAAFALLAGVGKILGAAGEGAFAALATRPEQLALFFDALTFCLAAVINIRLPIPRGKQGSTVPLKLARVWREFSDGLKVIGEHPMVRPWMLGIGMIFVGVGAFLSIALFYVEDVLGAGAAGYGLMVTTVGIGLAAGFVGSGIVTRWIPKDILFSSATIGLGASLILFASVSTLTTGAVMGVVLGMFAGLAYPTGLTLIQQSVRDSVRGRVLAAMNSVVRLALVGALALAPSIAKIIGSPHVRVFGQSLALDGSRVTLWIGGVSILAAGAVTFLAVRARFQQIVPPPGMLVAFEGQDGSGKTTQIERLAEWLGSQERQTLVTREPGGTQIGARLREILLDPASEGISWRTEALLYAADRAQHVAEVIRPAMERGEIVISDRYLFSSLAYQGLARGIGIEEVLAVNKWATGGLLPDVVFLLDLSAERAIERAGDRGGHGDRIEREGLAFQERVRDAYHHLSTLYPDRFLVVDASRQPDEIAQEIRHNLSIFIEEAAARRQEAQEVVST
jgi:dTMP kinase